MLRSVFVSGLALILGCSSAGPPAEVADRIFLGGDVVTVDASNRVVAALALRGQSILAVGSEAAVLRHRGPATQVVDLAGGAVLPGFIDSHGHLVQASRLAMTVNVASPPVGAVHGIEDLVGTLRAVGDSPQLPPDAWLVGSGYDDALLAEGRHPTRDDLDRVSRTRPVALFHVSLSAPRSASPYWPRSAPSPGTAPTSTARSTRRAPSSPANAPTSSSSPRAPSASPPPASPTSRSWKP